MVFPIAGLDRDPKLSDRPHSPFLPSARIREFKISRRAMFIPFVCLFLFPSAGSRQSHLCIGPAIGIARLA